MDAKNRTLSEPAHRGDTGPPCLMIDGGRKVKRYFYSILISAGLWMPLPLLLHFPSDTRTDYGRQVFWESFPLFLLCWFIMFLIVAALMHLVFARVIPRPGSWKFWIFPVGSLLAASVTFWVVWVSFTMLQQGPSLGDIVSYTYALLGILSVVFVSFIWITYPLAVANQWLITSLIKPKSIKASEVRGEPAD